MERENLNWFRDRFNWFRSDPLAAKATLHFEVENAGLDFLALGGCLQWLYQALTKKATSYFRQCLVRTTLNFLNAALDHFANCTFPLPDSQFEILINGISVGSFFRSTSGHFPSSIVFQNISYYNRVLICYKFPIKVTFLMPGELSPCFVFFQVKYIQKKFYED